MLLDVFERKKHPLIFAFSGVAFISSGTVSITVLQEFLLANLNDVLQQSPQYKNYFSVSTWLSFVAGLIYFIKPNTFTLWSAFHLIGVSVLYMFGAVSGIMEFSKLSFFVPYLLLFVAILFSGIETIKFHYKNAVIDVWVLAIIKLGYIYWAYTILKGVI